MLLSRHIEAAVLSMTPSSCVRISAKVRLSYFFASAFSIGSLSYTPSTFVAFRMMSAPISAARSEEAVSVEKYGLPESASGAEGIAKRSAKAKKTLYTIPEVYQTVIPYFEIIDGKCVKTELLPVSLGFYKERYKKNLPYVADEIEALAILEYLNRACRPYGVEWCYSGGIMIRSK